MNNQNTPEKKRLKVDDLDKSVDDKEQNIQRLRQMCEFFAKNKENFASQLEFDDCVNLLRLETQISKTVESVLFNGTCDTNGTIQDRLLHEAIKKNDQYLLTKLFSHGLVEKSICKHETPPLFQLLIDNRVDWIESLFKAGYSFADQKTKSGKPLLHFAMDQKGIKKDFIKKLLFYGAELSAKDSCDLTPLHYLLSNQVRMPNNKKEQFLKLFLKFGANTNSRTKFVSDTPLHTAVKTKNSQAVKFLLLYGANVNLKNSKMQTAFSITTADMISFGGNSAKDNILFFFTKHVNLLKLNGIHVDNNISCDRSIEFYKNRKIDKNMKKPQQQNALRILLWNENKLAKFYSKGEFDVSRIVKFKPFVYWKENLVFRIKKLRQRNVLLKKCESSFSQLSPLPSEIVGNVLQFLTTTDLRSLHAACYPKSFIEKLEIQPVNLMEKPSNPLSVEESDDDNDENYEDENNERERFVDESDDSPTEESDDSSSEMRDDLSSEKTDDSSSDKSGDDDNDDDKKEEEKTLITELNNQNEDFYFPF